MSVTFDVEPFIYLPFCQKSILYAILFMLLSPTLK